MPELPGYDAAHTGATFFQRPEPGLVHISGPDRLDFIQRQTTNDIAGLQPDRAMLTVLTSPTARILDVWRLLLEPDEQVAVITRPGRGAAMTDYLNRRIFFMDKVTVVDASDEVAQFELVGPEASACLDALGVAVPEPGGIAHLADPALRVIGLDGHVGRGFLLLVSAADAAYITGVLGEAGVVPLAAESYEVLRVEWGLPAASGELTGDYTPLEVNLSAAVSDRKGCYTGQEVIARQITYDKVTRQLVRLRLAEPVTAGARIEVEGRSAGTVTSAAVSPRLGAVALAVIKRPHNQPGTTVQVTGETLVDAQVEALVAG